VSSLSVGYFTDATSYDTINFHAKNLVKNVLQHYLVIVINHNTCFRLFVVSDVNILQGSVVTHEVWWTI